MAMTRRNIKKRRGTTNEKAKSLKIIQVRQIGNNKTKKIATLFNNMPYDAQNIVKHTMKSDAYLHENTGSASDTLIDGG
jgi:hypothetical protein